MMNQETKSTTKPKPKKSYKLKEHQRTEIVTFRLTEDELKQLDFICKVAGKPRCQIIRQLIKPT